MIAAIYSGEENTYCSYCNVRRRRLEFWTGSFDWFMVEVSFAARQNFISCLSRNTAEIKARQSATSPWYQSDSLFLDPLNQRDFQHEPSGREADRFGAAQQPMSETQPGRDMKPNRLKVFEPIRVGLSPGAVILHLMSNDSFLDVSGNNDEVGFTNSSNEVKT